MNGNIVKLPIDEFARDYLKAKCFRDTEFYKFWGRGAGVLDFNPRDGVMLAGGIWRRQLSHENAYSTDVDLFFTDKQALNDYYRSVTKYRYPVYTLGKQSNWAKTIWRNFQTTGVKLDSRSFREKRVTDQRVPIQFITGAYFKDPIELISQFNFTVNQFAFDGKDIYFAASALWDLRLKQLEIVNVNTRPTSTLYSLSKFLSYGYTISPSEQLRLNDASVAESKKAGLLEKEIEIWLS